MEFYPIRIKINQLSCRSNIWIILTATIRKFKQQLQFHGSSHHSWKNLQGSSNPFQAKTEGHRPQILWEKNNKTFVAVTDGRCRYTITNKISNIIWDANWDSSFELAPNNGDSVAKFSSSNLIRALKSYLEGINLNYSQKRFTVFWSLEVSYIRHERRLLMYSSTRLSILPPCCFTNLEFTTFRNWKSQQLA